MTVTTFSELELDESLLEALQDKGFTRPTAIQAAAIPPALDGRDVLGSAPTGTVNGGVSAASVAAPARFPT